MLGDDAAHRTTDEHNRSKLSAVKEPRECVRQSLHGVRARVVRRLSEPWQVNSDASSAKLREAFKGRLPIGRRLAISVNTDNRRWAAYPFDRVHCVLDQA
jgi:hypothetical protein